MDASIIIKLVVEEPGSTEARTYLKTLLKGGYALYTVDLALAECLNAVWKHAQTHKDLEVEDAKSAVQDLVRIYDSLQVVSARDLSGDAADISLDQNVTVYDSLYIAAAKKLRIPLYTADQKLHDISKEIVTSKLLGGSKWSTTNP